MGPEGSASPGFKGQIDEATWINLMYDVFYIRDLYDHVMGAASPSW